MKEKDNVPAKNGDEVKDIISGLGGVVVGITEWLYGCRRLFVQSRSIKDGRLSDPFTIDEPQAKIVKRGAVLATPNGGKRDIRGDRVKDRISGLTGIVFGVTNLAFSSARRIHVCPESHKDGRPAALFTMDEDQLEIVKIGAVNGFKEPEEAKPAEAPKKRPHGPRNEAGILHNDGPHRYDGF